ncbi:MAG: rhomboid family intramembrane serine protease [Cytophagaceae bacterium]
MLTIIITILTIVISIYAWNNPELYSKWLLTPYKVKKYNEFSRFITSGFIHADYMHLAFNMIAFFFFGMSVEGFFGSYLFVFLYLSGIVVSDIPTYLKHKNNFYYNSLGASGGVSSIIFSSILLSPLRTIRIFFIPMPGFVFGILYLIYSYYMSKQSRDLVNHDAHFYGAVYGIGFTIIYDPTVVPDFFQQLKHFSF